MTESLAIMELWELKLRSFVIFIGASSLFVPGIYETVDGTPITDVYSNFGPGEPDNARSDENCIVMHRNGLIYDDLCNRKYPFICKKSLASLEWNRNCSTPYSGYEYNEALGKCYKFSLKPMNWQSAYAFCKSELSYLTVINSQNEADHLVRITDRALKDGVKENYYSGVIYIGFHNIFKHGWKTIQDVSLADSGYSVWGKNEPSGGDNERCGSMYYAGQLNDLSCFERCLFVCEHDIDDTIDKRCAANEHSPNYLIDFLLDGQRDRMFFRRDYTFFDYHQSFFKANTLKKTWLEAKLACELEGASLFYPNDKLEAKDVLMFLDIKQIAFDKIFIGMSALLGDGIYETLDGKTLLDVPYTNFAPGEPNNSGNGDACMTMSNSSAMYDEQCTNKYPFVCKKTLASLEWNEKCDMPYRGYEFDANLGKCYKFHLNPMNWTSAYAVCNGELSYLAVINSQAEADHLVKITAEAPKESVWGNYLRGASHIGFHNKDGQGWRTIKGVPLADSGYDWDRRYTEPNGGDKEPCGSMFWSGPLNDIGCFQNCFFICEHDVEALSELIDNRIADDKK